MKSLEEIKRMLDNPTTETLYFVQEALIEAEKLGNQDHIRELRNYLEELQDTLGIVVRGFNNASAPMEICDPNLCSKDHPEFFRKCPLNPQKTKGSRCHFSPTPTTEEMKKIIYRSARPRREGFREMIEAITPSEEPPPKPDLPTPMPKEYERFVEEAKIEIAVAELVKPLKKKLEILEALSEGEK